MSPLSTTALIAACFVTLCTVVTVADGPLLPDSLNVPAVLGAMIAWLAFLIVEARDTVLRHIERYSVKLNYYEAQGLLEVLAERRQEQQELRYLKSVD